MLSKGLGERYADELASETPLSAVNDPSRIDFPYLLDEPQLVWMEVRGAHDG